MAYLAGNTTTKTTKLSFGERIGEIRVTAIEAYRAWRVYRRTLRELQGLSMRELNDLGLNASTIRRVALEAAYGKQV